MDCFIVGIVSFAIGFATCVAGVSILVKTAEDDTAAYMANFDKKVRRPRSRHRTPRVRHAMNSAPHK